jgi:hypothetical protein
LAFAIAYDTYILPIGPILLISYLNLGVWLPEYSLKKKEKKRLSLECYSQHVEAKAIHFSLCVEAFLKDPPKLLSR